MENRTVVVAMSGGVDSSVAAKILQDKGYKVIGVYMHLGFANEEAEEASRRVAEFLGIDFKVVDISKEFKQEVIDYFLDSYKKGLTPNPCVKCNKMIKFGQLLKIAEDLGGDYLATGHYLKKKYSRNYLTNCWYTFLVKTFKMKKSWAIFLAKDGFKDQTYFLYNLTQDKLNKITFPVGDMKKSRVKRLAAEAGLPHLKQESQDICFLSGDHNIFLGQHLEENPGQIKTMDGEVVGEHKGLYFYTVGQRRGIKIGGIGPFYVAKCDYDTNSLYIVKDWNDSVLYNTELIVKEVNWLNSKVPKLPFKCQAVIRYGHSPIRATLTARENGDYLVKFKSRQRAITSGQSVAFYRKGQLLGGGIISLE